MISRLNTLTAIIAIRERLLHVATQLSFLQHLLLHVMAVLDAYLLHALPHACQSPVITLIPYLQKNAAALCCHDAAEPGGVLLDGSDRAELSLVKESCLLPIAIIVEG